MKDPIDYNLGDSFYGGNTTFNNGDIFIIVGAGKSGTTSLAGALAEHPEICFSKVKEPRFFVSQASFRDTGNLRGPPNSGQYQKGMRYYRSLFFPTAKTRVFGEASTAYFYCEESAQLISEAFPTAKIVMILRDPVERIYSQYKHELKVGRDLPSFSELLNGGNGETLERYIWGSSYGSHLTRYLRYFPSENIAICDYHMFFSKFSESLRTLQTFLGVEPYDKTDIPSLRKNGASQPRSRIIAKLLRSVSHSGYGSRLPPKLRDMVGHVRAKVVNLNTDEVSTFDLGFQDRQKLLRLLSGEIELMERKIATNAFIMITPAIDIERWV